MDLLARREHGRVELTRKLRQRGAPSELIEQALDRLTEEGLLSESRYLESFIRYRAHAGFGPLRIREDLSQRGLAQDQKERGRQTRFIVYRGYPLEWVGRLLSGRSLDD
jgi:regulatory protein